MTSSAVTVRPVEPTSLWGALPRHWTILPLKRLGRFEGGGTPSKENTEFWKGAIPWVSPKDMKSAMILDSEDKISEEALKQSATQLVPVGCLLLVVRSGILNHSIPVAIAGREVALNQDLKAFISFGTLTPEYLRYFIEGHQAQLLVLWRKEGATVESLELELIANTRIPLPQISEQRAITAFLDRETAKIDALIAKKERLLALLEEKRTALITRAVTKGLDPAVPMKESGVEWFGEIPAHWEVRRLRYLSPSLGVGVVVNPSQYVADHGLPFLYGSDIVEGQILAEHARRISPEDSRGLPQSQLHAGDLVMVRVGAPGVTAVVPQELEGANCASILVIRRGTAFDASWLCYALNGRHVRSQVEIVQYGAAQEQFNVSHAANFLVGVPPLSEQHLIAAFLNAETAKVDSLVARIRDAIALLREYRTALISAAVTGQIDVTGAGSAGKPAARPSR